MTMTITEIVSTTMLLLALGAPATAQQKEATASGETAAQANEPDRAEAATRAQAAQERAEAAKQRAAERAAERAAAQAEARGTGAGVGVGRGFRFTLPILDPDALYEQARQAVENSQYQRAIEDFDRLVNDKVKEKMDAALYWKAYSQAKLDLDKEALQTVAELARQFASSPWVNDAKALAVQIQQAAGQPVSAELQNNEELKLLALRGVMQSDPEKGMPIIEKMLAGGASPRVRDRAMFVLAQSRTPRSREIMLNAAKNNSNPDLQRSAIRYLGMMGGTEDRDALNGIYRSATDVSVKRAILQSYFTGGNVDRMIDVAKNEKDPELRRIAIRNLGMMNRTNGANTSDALVSIYKSDNSSDIRRQVIYSLFIQRNAKALVDLAKAEKDPDLKRELVSKLSIMKAPEATDYMLELLK
jgi:hypothetical protein